MVNNENNKDVTNLAASITPSSDDSDFWDLDKHTSKATPSLDNVDLEAIDFEKIQAELDKKREILRGKIPSANLSNTELRHPEIDYRETITALETEQAKPKFTSKHNLTNEELNNFRTPVAPTVIIEKSNPIEKIMMTLCFVGILAFGAYFISYFYDKFEIETEKEWASNIPNKGEYASIDKVETWWTVPQISNTKFEVKLVPAATITLSNDSKTGILRAIFFSYEENIRGDKRAKGDPFPLPFVDGKFIATGSNSITIYGTDGYTDLSSFEYYRTQDEDRWTISIREAEAGETEANNFEELGHAPIEPIRKGTETTDPASE